MNKAQIDATVAANAAAVDLVIAAEHKPGVVAFFTLAADMYALVDGLRLDPQDESGSVYTPVSAQEAP